jgi:hypothetical protein
VARLGLSKAEIADLCTPAPIACAPWVRPLSHYRHEDVLHGSILRFG